MLIFPSDDKITSVEIDFDRSSPSECRRKLKRSDSQKRCMSGTVNDPIMMIVCDS